MSFDSLGSEDLELEQKLYNIRKRRLVEDVELSQKKIKLLHLEEEEILLEKERRKRNNALIWSDEDSVTSFDPKSSSSHSSDNTIGSCSEIIIDDNSEDEDEDDEIPTIEESLTKIKDSEFERVEESVNLLDRTIRPLLENDDDDSSDSGFENFHSHFPNYTDLSLEKRQILRGVHSAVRVCWSHMRNACDCKGKLPTEEQAIWIVGEDRVVSSVTGVLKDFHAVHIVYKLKFVDSDSYTYLCTGNESKCVYSSIYRNLCKVSATICHNSPLPTCCTWWLSSFANGETLDVHNYEVMAFASSNHSGQAVKFMHRYKDNCFGVQWSFKKLEKMFPELSRNIIEVLVSEEQCSGQVKNGQTKVILVDTQQPNDTVSQGSGSSSSKVTDEEKLRRSKNRKGMRRRRGKGKLPERSRRRRRNAVYYISAERFDKANVVIKPRFSKSRTGSVLTLQVKMDMVPWDENYTSPWHPRRYRHHVPGDVFQEARRMEKDMDRLTKNMRNMMESMERRVGLEHPKWDVDERPFDVLSPALEHHIEGNEKTPGKYTMSVPLGKHIHPQDLKVSCHDNVMTIESKKDRQSADGRTKVHQEFKRTFTLPENVDMMEVKSVLTPDGYLEIEAPLPVPAIKVAPQPLEIPIKRT